MPVLQATDRLALAQSGEEMITRLGHGSNLEDELDAMVGALIACDPSAPDQVMAVCMGLMGRCTELYLKIVRIEDQNRRLKVFRTMQLQKVMDLIDFEFRASSRMTELRRQEIDLSK